MPQAFTTAVTGAVQIKTATPTMTIEEVALTHFTQVLMGGRSTYASVLDGAASLFAAIRANTERMKVRESEREREREREGGRERERERDERRLRDKRKSIKSK